MCTLTFIPSQEKVIITSNRDEHISRANTDFPVTISKNHSTIYFPQDPKAGGTWVAANNKGLVSVLLNGAFEKHKHRPPYRLSRGILLLDTYEFSNLTEFSNQYNLVDIEPFTLVQLDTKLKIITELRWDGENKFVSTIDFFKPHIWSSSTLYSKEIREQRETWFNELLKNEELNPDSMLEFHQFGGKGNTKNSITMNRGNGLQTVSISQLIISEGNVNFTHNNLVSSESKSIQF